MRVALLFNLSREEYKVTGSPPDVLAELDSQSTIDAISRSLALAGHQVIPIEGKFPMLSKLFSDTIDIAFNICEGFRGRTREAQIPALLEMLGVPFTGSDALTMAVTLDKATAKRLLQADGVITPKFQVFYSPLDRLRSELPFPLFVKPVHEGSSMGIGAESRVENASALRERVAYVIRTYKQPALVEEFIDGREFTVGILGNEELTVFPVLEVNFAKGPVSARGVYSYQYKHEWTGHNSNLCPAPIPHEVAALIQTTAVHAYRTLGCRDFGRVDMRLDRDGVPQVIEINPLPGLAPDFSDFPRTAQAGGISYHQLINRILQLAVARYGLH